MKLPARPGGQPELATGGQGLVGMEERVAMYGGTLTAGDAAEGGFAVTASIPVGAEGIQS